MTFKYILSPEDWGQSESALRLVIWCSLVQRDRRVRRLNTATDGDKIMELTFCGFLHVQRICETPQPESLNLSLRTHKAVISGF